MSGPFTTVVLPVFNGERFLGACIDSVLGQTHPARQVVVVDDGSTDASSGVLDRYGDLLTRVSQTNGGPSMARRRGAEIAGGDLLAFIDQDDVWDPNKLERQVDVMRRYPQAVATYCDHRRIDAEGRVTAVSGSGYGLRGSGRILDALLQGNFILSASLVMVRRDAYDRAGGFLAERCFWADDYSLWMRLAVEGPVLYQAETLASYRMHEHNTSGDPYEKARGDVQALKALIEHLNVKGLQKDLKAARAACRRAMRVAAWNCRQRGEYTLATTYWLGSKGLGAMAC